MQFEDNENFEEIEDEEMEEEIGMGLVDELLAENIKQSRNQNEVEFTVQSVALPAEKYTYRELPGGAEFAQFEDGSQSVRSANGDKVHVDANGKIIMSEGCTSQVLENGLATIVTTGSGDTLIVGTGGIEVFKNKDGAVNFTKKDAVNAIVEPAENKAANLMPLPEGASYTSTEDGTQMISVGDEFFKVGPNGDLMFSKGLQVFKLDNETVFRTEKGHKISLATNGQLSYTTASGEHVVLNAK